MYKLQKNLFTKNVDCIIRLLDGAYIPMEKANTDYANFLKDLANGVELQDADGNVIDGKTYLETLI